MAKVTADVMASIVASVGTGARVLVAVSFGPFPPTIWDRTSGPPDHRRAVA